MPVNKILAIILAIGLLWFGAFVFKITSYETISIAPTPTVIPTYEPRPTEIPLSAEKLETLVNKWRISQGLQSFIHSEDMCRIAEIRLVDIKTDWSHNGFSADRFCTQLCTIGENLARGFSTEQDTLNGWLASPDHLAELKTPYTHTCIKTDQIRTVEIFGYF